LHNCHGMAMWSWKVIASPRLRGCILMNVLASVCELIGRGSPSLVGHSKGWLGWPVEHGVIGKEWARVGLGRCDKWNLALGTDCDRRHSSIYPEERQKKNPESDGIPSFWHLHFLIWVHLRVVIFHFCYLIDVTGLNKALLDPIA